MTEQLAMFDNPPTPPRPRRCAEPADQPLADLIAQHPDLERQLRVIRQLCAAHTTPLITGSRVTEHAGGHRWDAESALIAAAKAEWLYPAPGKAAFIPKR